MSELEGELERLREQYSSTRREKEQLHSELAHVKALSEKDAAARRSEVSTLKDIIKRHMMEEVTSCSPTSSDTNNNECVRALKAEVAELTAKSNTLLTENTELRAALDKSEASRETMMSTHELQMAEALAERASIEADKRKALRLLDLEKKDSEEHARQSRSAASALEEAKAETNRLQHELLQLNQLSVSTIDRLRSDGDANLKLTSTERDELRERVASLEEMILYEASSAENTDGDEGESDKETRQRLVLLQRQCLELEHHVFLLESERGNVEAENKRLRHACDACRMDNDLVSRQKEVLANQCSLAEKRMKIQADDNAKFKAEMEKIKGESETKKDWAIELEERCEKIEEDKGLLAMKLKQVEKDVLSAQKREASGKKALEKEIQRAALYRQKALEAHERSQQAKEALACLSLNVSENDDRGAKNR
jgi:hypothetical protein